MKNLFLTLTLVFFVTPFGISQDLPSYVPTDGLVAYYPFDGNANDESGNGIHGTVIGATLTSDRDGKENSSYSFDGVDDYIVLFDNGEINFDASDSFSYGLWFKQGASTENSYGNTAGTILASKNNARNGTNITVSYSNKTVTFFIEGDQDLDNSVASSSILNNWVYLSFVYDSSSRTLKAFNNGSKVDELVVTESLVGDLLYNSMWIGRRTNYTPLNTYVVGSFDDIGIWNRALTEQEIQNLYTSSDIILNGVVSAENNQIKNVADPTESNDAATKSYVDNRVSSVKFYGGWHENDNDASSSSEITVGNLMFRKNESSNYLEVKEVSSADQTIIVIYSPFSNGNNYKKVGDPSGGSQYNTTEWKSIVQVYNSANSNYDLVPGSLTTYNAREYEILERNNMSDPTTFSKYKIREYVDGYGQYVYSVEYYDFY